MRHTIAGAIILVAAVTTFITGTTFGFAVPFALVSVWDALNVLSQIVAPIVGALIAAVVWIHNRLRSLERGQNSLNRSVFGEERNELSRGVTGEVGELVVEVSKLHKKVDELKDDDD